MNETIKLWLLTMLHNELNEVNGDLQNNSIWRAACDDATDAANLDDNLENLTEYKKVLETLKKQVEEGRFNV